MMNRFFALMMLSCALFISGCGDKKQELCTDKSISSLAANKFGKNQTSQELLETLKTNYYISQKYSEQTRTDFVNIQYIVESSLASLAKYNQVLKVIGVIYSPTPPTALRTDGTKVKGLLNEEQIKNPEIIDSIISRHESLHDFLQSGSMLYAIHKPTPLSLPGLEIYNSNLEIYKHNLKDVSVSNVDKNFVGASYLAECKNGQKILFSILSNQLSNTNIKPEWQIFYGDINNNQNLYNQYILLKNLYKEAGVEFSID